MEYVHVNIKMASILLSVNHLLMHIYYKMIYGVTELF